MGASTKRRPSTRCATSNGFCGADRHYAGASFEQLLSSAVASFDQSLPLGLCLVAFLAAIACWFLLDTEITYDEGLTSLLARPSVITEGISWSAVAGLTLLLLKGRSSPCGLHLILMTTVLLLAPGVMAMEGGDDAGSAHTSSVSVMGLVTSTFICSICRFVCTSNGNLRQHVRSHSNPSHRSRAKRRVAQSGRAPGAPAAEREEPTATHDEFGRVRSTCGTTTARSAGRGALWWNAAIAT